MSKVEECWVIRDKNNKNSYYTTIITLKYGVIQTIGDLSVAKKFKTRKQAENMCYGKFYSFVPIKIRN